MEQYQVITDRKIKVGIVGCGRISINHFKSIEIHNDSIELVGVCDNDINVLKRHIIDYKVNGYVEFEEMLKAENLDVVVICTPSGLHAEQTILAAKYKVNVLCEKPMSTDWNDGIKMVESCRKNRVRLFIVKQNRRNTTLQLLKKAIEENRFGIIHMVNINVFWTRPQEYYDQAPWRGTWSLDGGAFMNQASHYVDLLDWLIGPVSEVHAFSSTTRKIEAEDTGVLNIKWKNGTLGSMNVTMLTYPKNYEGSITIIGRDGTVKIGGIAVNQIEHWEFKDSREYDQEINDSSYETTSVYGFGHPLYYKNFIESMRGEASPETDGEEGLKSLELIIAAYNSAKNEQVVKLPLPFKSH